MRARSIAMASGLVLLSLHVAAVQPLVLTDANGKLIGRYSFTSAASPADERHVVFITTPNGLGFHVLGAALSNGGYQLLFKPGLVYYQTADCSGTPFIKATPVPEIAVVWGTGSTRKAFLGATQGRPGVTGMQSFLDGIGFCHSEGSSLENAAEATLFDISGIWIEPFQVR